MCSASQSECNPCPSQPDLFPLQEAVGVLSLYGPLSFPRTLAGKLEQKFWEHTAFTFLSKVHIYFVFKYCNDQTAKMLS